MSKVENSSLNIRYYEYYFGSTFALLWQSKSVTPAVATDALEYAIISSNTMCSTGLTYGVLLLYQTVSFVMLWIVS